MFLFLLVLVSSAMASPPNGHGDGPVCGPHTDLNEAPSTLYGETPHDEYAGSDSVHSNPNPSRMLATAPSSPTYTMASHRPHIHIHTYIHTYIRTHTHTHSMAAHCHSLEYVHERHCIGRTNAVSPCVLTSAPHIHATSPPSPPVIQAHTSRPASAPAPALSSSLLLHKCHPPFDQRSRLRPLRSRQPTYVCIRGVLHYHFTITPGINRINPNPNPNPTCMLPLVKKGEVHRNQAM